MNFVKEPTQELMGVMMVVIIKHHIQFFDLIHQFLRSDGALQLFVLLNRYKEFLQIVDEIFFLFADRPKRKHHLSESLTMKKHLDS